MRRLIPRKLSLAFLRLLFVYPPSPTALSGCWSVWKGVFFGTCRDWSDVKQGCLGWTYWAQVKWKQDKQGDIRFQTRQDSLGEPAFAASEA